MAPNQNLLNQEDGSGSQGQQHHSGNIPLSKPDSTDLPAQQQQLHIVEVPGQQMNSTYHTTRADADSMDAIQAYDHVDAIPLSAPNPVHYAHTNHDASFVYPSQPLEQTTASRRSNDALVAKRSVATHPKDSVVQQVLKLDKKWQRRLYW